MFRLLLPALALSLFVGSGLWIKSLLSDNAALEQSLDTAVQSNQSYVTAMKVMVDRQNKIAQQNLAREKFQRVQTRELHALRKSLETAKNTLATKAEVKCLESAVPTYIVDLLHGQPKGSQGDKS